MIEITHVTKKYDTGKIQPICTISLGTKSNKDINLYLIGLTLFKRYLYVK